MMLSYEHIFIPIHSVTIIENVTVINHDLTSCIVNALLKIETQTVSYIHTHTHKLSHIHKLSLKYIHTNCYLHTNKLSLTHTHIYIYIQTVTYVHTHKLSLTNIHKNCHIRYIPTNCHYNYKCQTQTQICRTFCHISRCPY